MTDIATQAVAAQKAKLVGDDKAPDPVEVTPDVTAEKVPAQVIQAREPDPKTVNVHEVRVETDEVIKDPSDPRAVQIPDAGRGSLDLPIHTFADGERVEDVFAREDESAAPASK